MNILSIIIWVPIAGLALILALPRHLVAMAKAIALVASGTSMVLAWTLLFEFDRDSGAQQFTESTTWIPELGMTYELGVDGLSLTMVLLGTLVSVVAVLASFKVEHNPKAYFAWMMLLEFSLLGVFVARDWFLFYVFWEISLVPLFFLIGAWGGPRRERATMSFFLYTLGGSIFMLIGILALYVNSDPRTFDMATLAASSAGWSQNFQILAFLAFFAGFGVKLPAVPFHRWLPLAHGEAPVPVSVILGAVTLKLGAYGLIRISGTLPVGFDWFLPALVTIAIVNILYGALLASRQTNLKLMVAYSSISHMGFVILGIAADNAIGMSGAVFMMVAHGIITGSLFLLIGMLQERTTTIELSDLTGVARQVPVLSALLTIALIASMGLPGLAQFVAEFQSFVGAFERWGLLVLLASVGVVITAMYILRVIGVLFGLTRRSSRPVLRDLGGRELIISVPLAALTIGLGIFPGLLLALFNETIGMVMP